VGLPAARPPLPLPATPAPATCPRRRLCAEHPDGQHPGSRQAAGRGRARRGQLARLDPGLLAAAAGAAHADEPAPDEAHVPGGARASTALPPMVMAAAVVAGLGAEQALPSGTGPPCLLAGREHRLRVWLCGPPQTSCARAACCMYGRRAWWCSWRCPSTCIGHAPSPPPHTQTHTTTTTTTTLRPPPPKNQPSDPYADMHPVLMLRTGLARRPVSFQQGSTLRWRRRRRCVACTGHFFGAAPAACRRS
jgi:hypothetical protein